MHYAESKPLGTQSQTLFIRQKIVHNGNYIFNVIRPRWWFNDTSCVDAYDFMTIEILKMFTLIDNLKLREITDGGGEFVWWSVRYRIDVYTLYQESAIGGPRAKSGP